MVRWNLLRIGSIGSTIQHSNAVKKMSLHSGLRARTVRAFRYNKSWDRARQLSGSHVQSVSLL